MKNKRVLYQQGIDDHYKVWHTTGRHMLIYMYSQGGSIVCREKTYPIARGVLCFVGAEKYHYTMPSQPEEYRRTKLFISDVQLRRLLTLLPEESPVREMISTDALVYAQISGDQQLAVETLLAQLIREEEDDSLFFGGYLQLLSYVQRNAAEKAHSPGGYLAAAVAYINAHAQESISIEEICAAAHISKYHFCRRFKEVMGLTVMEYVLQTRLVIAKDLLSSGSLPVGQISEICGFSSPSYFCRVFQQHTGISPGKYRQKSRINI